MNRGSRRSGLTVQWRKKTKVKISASSREVSREVPRTSTSKLELLLTHWYSRLKWSITKVNLIPRHQIRRLLKLPYSRDEEIDSSTAQRMQYQALKSWEEDSPVKSKPESILHAWDLMIIESVCSWRTLAVAGQEMLDSLLQVRKVDFASVSKVPIDHECKGFSMSDCRTVAS